MLPRADVPHAASPVRVVEILYRRRRGMGLILLATVLSTAAWLFLIRGDAYVSEAKLLVRLGQEQAPMLTMIGDERAVVASQPGYAASETEVFHSRDLLERLADEIDLREAPVPPPATWFGRVRHQARDAWHTLRDGAAELMMAAGLKARLTPREAAVEALSRALLVEVQPNSFIVSARFVWPGRGVGVPVLDRLVELYLAYRARIYHGATTVGFFRERRAEAAARLAAAAEALASFERANGIVNLDDQQAELQKRLAAAAASADAARLELLTIDPARGRLGATAGAPAAVAAQLSVTQGIAATLANAGARSAGLQASMGENNAALQQQRAEMSALTASMGEQVQALRAAWTRQVAQRDQMRDALQAQLTRLHDATERWQELRRDVAQAARALDYNDTKLTEAGGIAALETARISNVIVVQQAAEEATPAGLRKSSMLLLSLAAGAVFALAWAAVREFLDHRIHDAAGAERLLGLPVLAVLPVERTLRARA